MIQGRRPERRTARCRSVEGQRLRAGPSRSATRSARPALSWSARRSTSSSAPAAVMRWSPCARLAAWPRRSSSSAWRA